MKFCTPLVIWSLCGRLVALNVKHPEETKAEVGVRTWVWWI